MESGSLTERPQVPDRKGAMKDVLVSPRCDAKCCAELGAEAGLDRLWPTALAGFIAGVVVTLIILLPWMVLQDRLRTVPFVPPPVTEVDGEEQGTGGMTEVLDAAEAEDGGNMETTVDETGESN